MSDGGIFIEEPGGGAATARNPQPSDNGLLAWSVDPAVCVQDAQTTAGTIRLIKIFATKNITITNIWVYVNTAGVTLTAGQNFAGIYSSAGVLLGKTADQAAAWQSAGVKTMPVVAEAGQSLTIAGGPSVFFWVALLTNGTTQPFFISGNANSNTANLGLTAPAARFGVVNAGQTALPATFVLANVTPTARSTFAGIT